MFMESIINAPDFNEFGIVDEELKSVKTLLTNTTGVVAQRYQRRNFNKGTTQGGTKEETKDGRTSTFSA